MATNDFWNRLSGAQGADPRITAFAFWCSLNDLVLPGAGGLSQVTAAGLWQLSGDALTEFNDLAASFLTVTNANTDTRLQRRLAVASGIFAAVALGEQGELPGNPYVAATGYGDGEKIRSRAKALISAAGGTPQGTLAA